MQHIIFCIQKCTFKATGKSNDTVACGVMNRVTEGVTRWHATVFTAESFAYFFFSVVNYGSKVYLQVVI